MKLKHLTCPVSSVKALDEDQGIVEAIVNTYNLRDSGGDRVLLGCFQESIDRRRPYCVFSHDWNRPLGKCLEARELPPGDPLLPAELKAYGGLYTKTQYNLETQDGRETFSHLKMGVLDQFSIGFSIDEERRAKDGANELVKGNLYEYGPVLWGMNPATAVVSVKSAAPQPETKAQYLGEYAEEEMTLAALRDCCDSLFYRAIYAILFDYDGERSAQEKVEGIDAALQEFHSLCVQCLKAMLEASEGDEDAGAEMAAEYKSVFPPPPALAAGRLNAQLDAALAAVSAVTDRAKRLHATRETEGRSLSPARREQLAQVKGALDALLEATAPAPSLDIDLFRMKASARRRRLMAAGAIGEK